MQFLTNSFNYFRNVINFSGFFGFFDDFKNWLGSWSLKKKQNENGQKQTSLSDVDSYNTICNLAATNQKIFKKFKSNVEYRSILEHVSRRQGYEYLRSITDQEILNLIPGNSIQEFGKPYKYIYRGYGRISPTQLRYFKTLADLKMIFGNLDGYTVTEIGPGYAGLALTIDSYFRLTKYTLIDLPSAISLAKIYSSKHGHNSPFEFVISEKVQSVYSDLAISNYAFSEIQKSHQELLLENVLKKAKRGYIIYNKISSDIHNFLTLEEICNHLPNPEVKDEIPLTGEFNRLILWGHT